MGETGSPLGQQCAAASDSNTTWVEKLTAIRSIETGETPPLAVVELAGAVSHHSPNPFFFVACCLHMLQCYGSGACFDTGARLESVPALIRSLP